MSRNRPRPFAGFCLLALAAYGLGAGCAGGCQLFQPPAAGVGGTALTPLQSQQQAVDSVEQRYGLVMDVLTPLIERGVLTDPPTLRIIRTAVKQIDADVKSARASLAAGKTLDAAFLTDRVVGAVVTLEKIRDVSKGAGK